MEARKIVYRETLIIALGEGILVPLMFAVFALLGYFDKTVLLGGIIGALLAVTNFFLMAAGVSLASDKAVNQDVKGGKALVKSSYIFRMALIFLVLFACVKSGLCNALAAVIPLMLVRIIMTIAEFFRKDGEKQV